MAPRDGLGQWVKVVTAESAYIFVARVTRVSDKPATVHGLGPSATVSIKESLKGTPKLKVVDTHACQNFPLRLGETRVFFVDANAVVLGCSDYRSFATDTQILSELRALSK